MSTFNLQRQLDAAADQRRLAAGLAAEQTADESAASLPVWQGQTDDPATSTLLPPIDAVASGAGPDANQEPVATRTPMKDRCPRCAGKVSLDRFDLDQGIAIMRCTDCGVRYRAKSPKGPKVPKG